MPGYSMPLSASCYYRGHLYVRFSGAPSAVDAATKRVAGTALADAEEFWASLREQTHEFFTRREAEAPLWRISVQSTTPYADLGGDQLLEWGGASRWLKLPARADDGSAAGSAAPLREWAQSHGGHATLYRSRDKSIGVFQPLAAPAMALHRRLKAAFDPAGIFNPGRLYPGL